MKRALPRWRYAMGNLEKRVAQIEGDRANTDLKKMSDEELSA